MDLMLQTINLAKRGTGHTSPNPLVGALIVKNGKIIAKGYHKQAGGDHAEIAALKKAGRKAKDAIMYINLEPCCHHGKTPPCTKAIIKSGIKEIHIAMLDPNPLICGQGKKELTKAGIKVIVGELQNQAKKLNETFCKYITTNQPFITAKWAMSLDGKIATHTGDSKWISNEKSRKLVHKLRQQYDAVMVGVNTIIKDDPKLTVRTKIKKPAHPTRIVLDSTGRTPLSAKIFEQPGQVILVTTKKIFKKKERLYNKLGAKVIRIKSKNGQIDLTTLTIQLGKQAITSILIEGGNHVITSAVEQNLIDKAYIFIGNKIIGGQQAKTPVAGQGIAKISLAHNWKIEKIKRLDDDILLVAYPNK